MNVCIVETRHADRANGGLKKFKASQAIGSEKVIVWHEAERHAIRGHFSFSYFLLW